MTRDKEIVTRVCAQLTKYLLEKSAETVKIVIKKDTKYNVEISSKVSLDREELDVLRNYLSVQPQEVGYYYLPLVGEYGAEEDLAVVAMLMGNIELRYDEKKRELIVSFHLR